MKPRSQPTAGLLPKTALALRRLGRGLADLCFPLRCCHCGGEPGPADGLLLCPACRVALAPPRGHVCARCGSATAAGPGGCLHCRGRRLRFERAVCLGAYEGPLRLALLRIKRAGQEPLAAALAELFWSRCQRELTALAPDVVVCVPMHWTRRLVRGTSSPEVVAQRLARRLGVPCEPQMLRQRRRTLLQASLPRTARLRNVRRAFAVRRGYRCAAARVLLIDDVLTTAATANEAARTLLRTGAGSVVVAALARAESPVPL